MTEAVEIHAVPNMDSAGAELMSLSFRLEKHPEFAEDAKRIREIGGWVSVSRIGDMEMSLIKVIGAMVGTMRRRNLVFNEDLPMEPQFLAFLEALPDPLPGQPGYVDQNTLAPTARRDTFEAVVEMADLRTWTAHDDVPRAVARICQVSPPGGVPEETMVFAEGAADVALLSEGGTATLRLRSTGKALRIVGGTDQG